MKSKELFQYVSASVMLLSGVILTFICFFLNHYEINDSVEWYVSQVLIYAGSVFGISIVINSKFDNIKNKLNKHDKDENE